MYKVDNGGPLWTHEVVVIVPRSLLFKNVSTLYMASVQYGCNNDEPITSALSNADIDMMDQLTADSRSIGVVSYQTPNCPMDWANDPEHIGRRGDNQVAWSLKDFLISTDNDPRRLILMPMAKAALL